MARTIWSALLRFHEEFFHNMACNSQNYEATPIPKTIVPKAKIIIPRRIVIGTSFACSACLLRGNPRNAVPKCLTTPPATNAPVNPSAAAANRLRLSRKDFPRQMKDAREIEKCPLAYKSI